MRLRWGAATDRGLRRSMNQDGMLANGKIFAVADGMGGHAGGEVASKLAIDRLGEVEEIDLTPGQLPKVVEKVNRVIYEEARRVPSLSGMGTTLTMMVPITSSDPKRVEVLSVGDSRAYLLHDLDLIQVTEDHTYVGELLRAGRISEEDASVHGARHVLTRVLGVEPDIAVDLWEIDPHPGDVVLLCSDGLSNELVEPQIRKVLIENSDPQRAADELIALAKANGGSDNITAVVVHVLGDDDGAQLPVSARAAVATGSAGTLMAENSLEGSTPRVSVSSMTRKVEFSSIPTPLPRNSVQKTTLLLSLLRVLLFGFVLAAILGIVAGAIDLYVKNSYYVGESAGRVAIYQGRAGGILWFDPKLVDVTKVDVASLNPIRQAQVKVGVVETSVKAADSFVSNLIAESQAQAQVSGTPTSTAGG